MLAVEVAAAAEGVEGAAAAVAVVVEEAAAVEAEAATTVDQAYADLIETIALTLVVEVIHAAALRL